MLAVLFKYRLKMALGAFRGGRRVGRTLLLVLAFAMLAFALGSFSYGLLKYAELDPVQGPRVLENLVALSFHGMFLLLLFWGMSQAVFTIFFSGDLALLLSYPIARRDVFIYKVLEATFLNARVSFLFLVPTLIVFGLHHRAPPPYYVIAALVTFFMAATPGALGILIAAFLSRRIPRARLRGAITVTGSLIGIGLWALINQFSGRFTSGEADFGSATMKTTSIASSPIFQYLPSGWAFNAINKITAGDLSGAVFFLLVLAAASLALGYVALAATARYYSGGIAEEVAPPSRAAGRLAIGGSPLMAHIRRDLILFTREPGVIMQSLVMAAFLLLYPFVTRPGGPGENSGLAISPIAVLFAAFFGGQIGSRLLALERLGFWQNLVIPSGRRLTLTSKFILGLAFVTALSALIALVHRVALKSQTADAVFLTVLFSWIGFAVGAVVASFWSNFNWDHPKRMLKGGGGFAYALAIMVVGVAMYALAYAAYRFLADFVSPLVVIGVFSVGILSISFIVSALRVLNMEWTPDV